MGRSSHGLLRDGGIVLLACLGGGLAEKEIPLRTYYCNGLIALRHYLDSGSFNLTFSYYLVRTRLLVSIYG